MRIVQIIPNLASGGAERFVVDLCNELSKEYEVHLITFFDADNSEFLRNSLTNKTHTHTLGKKIGFDMKIIFKLFRIIKIIKPDLIHSHLSSLNYLLFVIPFFRNVSFIHTVHNDAFKEAGYKWIKKTRSLFYNKKLILPVTISSESDRSFREAYKKTVPTLILNGRVYPDKTILFEKAERFINSIKLTSDTKIFVTIGRLETQKNQLMLVNSFNRLLTKYQDSKLIIIGGERNSETSKRIKKQLKEKAGNNIILLGELENATDYLHLAEYFCLSSLHEGMPITLIESFACKCIPICTPVGGMKEMIENIDSNLLSNSTSEDDYLKALDYAITLNENNRESLKNELAKSFENNYSMKICSERYIELYYNSISVRKRKSLLPV